MINLVEIVSSFGVGQDQEMVFTFGEEIYEDDKMVEFDESFK